MQMIGANSAAIACMSGRYVAAVSTALDGAAHTPDECLSGFMSHPFRLLLRSEGSQVTFNKRQRVVIGEQLEGPPIPARACSNS
jgi:hypothetical protein